MDNDILPAKGIEMKTVWILGKYANQISKEIQSKADYTMETIADIKTIL